MSKFRSSLAWFTLLLLGIPCGAKPLSLSEKKAIGGAVASHYRRRVTLSYLIDSRPWFPEESELELVKDFAKVKKFDTIYLRRFLTRMSSVDATQVAGLSNFTSRDFFPNSNYGSRARWDFFYKKFPSYAGFIALAGVNELEKDDRGLILYSHSYSAYGCGQTYLLQLKSSKRSWVVEKAVLVSQYEHYVSLQAQK